MVSLRNVHGAPVEVDAAMVVELIVFAGRIRILAELEKPLGRSIIVIGAVRVMMIDLARSLDPKAMCHKVLGEGDRKRAHKPKRIYNGASSSCMFSAILSADGWGKGRGREPWWVSRSVAKNQRYPRHGRAIRPGTNGRGIGARNHGL